MTSAPGTHHHVTPGRRLKLNAVNCILVIFIGLAGLVLIYCVTKLSHQLKFGGYAEIAGSEASGHRFTFPRPDPDELTQSFFRPLLYGGVMTYTNVCIQTISHPVTQSIRFKTSTRDYNETKAIVIYDSDWNGNNALGVAGSGNSIWNFWNLSFSKSHVPSHARYHMDKVAYFVSPTCPGNLHHFWEDEFRMLHSVVSVTGRLQSRNKNQLFYRIPGDLDPDDMACYNATRYQDFIYLLNFEKFHDVFFRVEGDTCYEHGVFGLGDYGTQRRDTVEYILRKANISRQDCPQGEILTIIDRQHRRILNVPELVKLADSMGYDKVQVVRLEKHTVFQQLQIAACSTVWVGVQGAGLQWSIFMSPGSTLVEIAWPEKHWGFYFANWVVPYNIDYKRIQIKDVRINWPSYQDQVLRGKVVSAEDREKLMTMPPTDVINNIWKWADVVVEQTLFKYATIGRQYSRKRLT